MEIRLRIRYQEVQVSGWYQVVVVNMYKVVVDLVDECDFAQFAALFKGLPIQGGYHVGHTTGVAVIQVDVSGS